MRRSFVLLFGISSYVLTLGVLGYLAGWMGGFVVPTRLDGPREGSVATALAFDLLLVAIFGLQHSVMARPGFKRWWTQFVPVDLERSVYMLASNAALALMFWQWRPLGGTIWHLESTAARTTMFALFGLGWVMVLTTTFLINHFDLFGLRQVWLSFRGRPYTQLRFVTPLPYRVVRHPLYVGWLTTFWATPTMTAAHLVFALGMTAYILVAIRYEERDLMEAHPGYADYRRRVPMLVPCTASGGGPQTKPAIADSNATQLAG